MNVYNITSEIFNIIKESDKTELEKLKQKYENSNIIFEYELKNAWYIPIFAITIINSNENNLIIYEFKKGIKTHTIKKEKIQSIIELIKQYKDIFSSENYYIENSYYLDGYIYNIILSDIENLYNFINLNNIGSYAPNVQHLIKLLDSIFEKFDINDDYKPYKYT